MRRTNFSHVIVCFVLFIGIDAAIQSAKAEVHRNIEYAKAGDIALHLDLYLPEKGDSPSLIVWIHGGWDKTRRDMALKFFDKHVKGSITTGLRV